MDMYWPRMIPHQMYSPQMHPMAVGYTMVHPHMAMRPMYHHQHHHPRADLGGAPDGYPPNMPPMPMVATPMTNSGYLPRYEPPSHANQQMAQLDHYGGRQMAGVNGGPLPEYMTAPAPAPAPMSATGPAGQMAVPTSVAPTMPTSVETQSYHATNCTNGTTPTNPAAAVAAATSAVAAVASGNATASAGVLTSHDPNSAAFGTNPGALPPYDRTSAPMMLPGTDPMRMQMAAPPTGQLPGMVPPQPQMMPQMHHQHHQSPGMPGAHPSPGAVPPPMQHMPPQHYHQQHQAHAMLPQPHHQAPQMPPGGMPAAVSSIAPNAALPDGLIDATSAAPTSISA